MRVSTRLSDPCFPATPLLPLPRRGSSASAVCLACTHARDSHAAGCPGATRRAAGAGPRDQTCPPPRSLETTPRACIPWSAPSVYAPPGAGAPPLRPAKAGAGELPSSISTSIGDSGARTQGPWLSPIWAANCSSTAVFSCTRAGFGGSAVSSTCLRRVVSSVRRASSSLTCQRGDSVSLVKTTASIRNGAAGWGVKVHL